MKKEKYNMKKKKKKLKIIADIVTDTLKCPPAEFIFLFFSNSARTHSYYRKNMKINLPSLSLSRVHPQLIKHAL